MPEGRNQDENQATLDDDVGSQRPFRGLLAPPVEALWKHDSSGASTVWASLHFTRSRLATLLVGMPECPTNHAIPKCPSSLTKRTLRFGAASLWVEQIRLLRARVGTASSYHVVSLMAIWIKMCSFLQGSCDETLYTRNLQDPM